MFMNNVLKFFVNWNWPESFLLLLNLFLTLEKICFPIKGFKQHMFA